MSESKPSGDTHQPLDLTALDLDQLLGLFSGILAAKALQYMGLRLTPGKEDVERDLVKAAAAIDCVSIMIDKMAPRLSDEELSSLRSMIADLQLNYARQS